MRSNYWSCTKFADWVRGTAKLHSGTSKEWREWEKSAKAFSNFRYWLAEDGLDFLQKLVFYIPDRINSVRYYLNNRFIIRTHALTAHPRDIKRGNWCDVGNRFLPCMFNALVDYVEIEKAWMHVAWDPAAQEQFEVPFWRKRWWLRWFVQWRSKEAGIAYLKWEMSLTYNDDWIDKADPLYGTATPQAVAAKEIYDLYMWWTVDYKNRLDPYDASGWTDLCNGLKGGLLSIIDEDIDRETEDQKTESLKELDRIEAAYEKEDEEMLIRLIKVRNSLWT